MDDRDRLVLGSRCMRYQSLELAYDLSRCWRAINVEHSMGGSFAIVRGPDARWIVADFLSASNIILGALGRGELRVAAALVSCRLIHLP